LDIEIDLEHRPHCGGELKLIVDNLELAVIDRPIMHVGL